MDYPEAFMLSGIKRSGGDDSSFMVNAIRKQNGAPDRILNYGK